MKRHPALQQLSRDHHHALVVAMQLQRASDDTASEAGHAFGTYWERELFPLIEASLPDAELRQLVARLTH